MREIESTQLIEVSESLLDLIAGKKFGTASDAGIRPGSRRTAIQGSADLLSAAGVISNDLVAVTTVRVSPDCIANS